MKLINGECIAELKTINAKSVDLILTDLPYGTTACKWDTVIPFDQMWAAIDHILKPNGCCIFTGCQPFTSLLITSRLDMFKYNLIWKKPQGVDPFMAKIRPLNNIEEIMIFAKGKTTYNPIRSKGKPYTVKAQVESRVIETINATIASPLRVNTGSRLPTRVLEFKQERGLHPTQKPVELMEYLIKTYSNEGEMVLDMTMGSGTTGVAAINTNRDFIGIELDGKYFDIASDRISDAEFDCDI